MCSGGRRIRDGYILLMVGDLKLSNMLREHLEPRYHLHSDDGFYDILVETQSEAVIKICSERDPLIIVIDTDSSDVDVNELADRISDSSSIATVSFVFLETKDQVQCVAKPSESWKKYSITKPFVMEDLERIIQSIGLRNRVLIDVWKNPITHLPSGKAIQAQIEAIILRQGWVLLYIEANGLEPGDPQSLSATKLIERSPWLMLLRKPLKSMVLLRISLVISLTTHSLCSPRLEMRRAFLKNSTSVSQGVWPSCVLLQTNRCHL